MKKKEGFLNNILGQPDKFSSIYRLKCLDDNLQEIIHKVHFKQVLANKRQDVSSDFNKPFAYYRDEIDSIWLANHNSTIKEQRSWQSLEVGK